MLSGCPSVRSSATKVEPILMPVGTSGPRDKGIKRSTLGVRRSKVKVTRRQWSTNFSEISQELSD